MQWWQWLIVAGMPPLTIFIQKMWHLVREGITGRIEEVEGMRDRFEVGLQKTIDNLRMRLDIVEARERICIAELATVKQRLFDLEAEAEKRG